MSKKTPITVAYGDGIGPDIMGATLKILDAAGASLDIETIEIGEKVYKRGVTTGIEASAWESLLRTRVFLKAPITTPQGGGYQSLNVATRKRLGLYANVRPCKSYHPFVHTKHPEMDLVIVRENEEDCYAGIEHRQTTDVVQCLKLISRPGCERIVRYAFEYAKANNRQKVTCFTKDNIMKMTDGLFHRTFDEIGEEYPNIEKEHWIIDIGAAKIADKPELFDVVVMPNLYGDIVSDITAQITGSVGLVGSSNIGLSCAMFEAIHGSAPRMVGEDRANPSALLLGAVLMLVHVGLPETAELVHNAWLRTIEEGVHTPDIYTEGISKKRVGTQGFTQAVIERMGKRPEKLKPVSYNKEGANAHHRYQTPAYVRPYKQKDLVGVDVFVEFVEGKPKDLADKVLKCKMGSMQMKMISNRGIAVWPDTLDEVFCVDHYRCRFLGTGPVSEQEIVDLLASLVQNKIHFIKIENLYTFDGVEGFTS